MEAKKKKKIAIEDYLYIVVAVCMTFTITERIPVVGRPWVAGPLGVLLGMYLVKIKEWKNIFVILIVYGLVVFLNFFSGDTYFDSAVMVAYELMYLFVPFTMFLYFQRVPQSANLLKTIFIFFLIECTAVSVYADSVFPGLIRMQSNGDSIREYWSLLGPFRRMGLSSYGLPHAIPVFIPALVYIIKRQTGKHRWGGVILLLTSLSLVYVSNSSTALILSLIVTPMSFFVSGKRGNSVLLLFVIVMPLVLNQTVQVKVLESLSSLTQNNSLFETKRIDIEESIMYGEVQGGVAVRQSLYAASFEAFFENPIMGVNDKKYGGHSALLDRLAMLGFLGFLPLSLLFYRIYKFTLKCLPKESRVYYKMGFLVGIIMLSAKNMFGWAMFFFMFFLLPMLIILQDYNKSTSEIQ